MTHEKHQKSYQQVHQDEGHDDQENDEKENHVTAGTLTFSSLNMLSKSNSPIIMTPVLHDRTAWICK